ncbi:hypothetical protein SPFL3102_03372 [Sporomusaceae bacterium FL31]|nr:hypothetical protein SPFL3101_01934 [Sporomusaceae bacterium FL31]GCE35529.1 hypothetical protein SPFL3102_03372 [Sporomusaceae bacterium]
MEKLVWLEKYGIKNEVLLEINPKLVISAFHAVHLRGYTDEQIGALREQGLI